MDGAAIRIEDRELVEDRYSRLRLIPWWNQRKLAAARILLVGAGALGNEILKNLALLGVGSVVVVDLDRIETSNLSRTVLYRVENVGDWKVDAAARGAHLLCPDTAIQPLALDVQQCGLGLFRWADIIIAGVDNREARLWVNRAAWKVNRPWVDGAIEGINGVARVFMPGTPPCYECTLGDTDWAILRQRLSCNLLRVTEDTEGKTPTTPTVSSVIAGIQVQEAVKLLHGLPVLAGRAYVFEGLNHSSYVVTYTENPKCMSHYVLEDVVELPQASAEVTLGALRERARMDLRADDVVIEFSRDIIDALVCPACGKRSEVFAPAGTLSRDEGRCPEDGKMRIVSSVHSFSGTEGFGDCPVAELGLPLYDIFTARSGDREISYLIAGDAPLVLGPLVVGLDRNV